MSLSRRTLLRAGPPMLALSGVIRHAAAATPDPRMSDPRMSDPRMSDPRMPDPRMPDPRMTDRSLGSPDAKVVVQEWFSLTCTHCARFSQTVFPDVKAKLIDTGRIRYVYHDFPLDQVALTAAMVARALPAERYEPFVQSLFASQDRWAFSQTNDPQVELAKMAALAGMPHDAFQRTVDDQGLRQAILDEQNAGQAKYKIDSTPAFIFGSRLYSGEMEYDAFLKQVTAGT